MRTRVEKWAHYRARIKRTPDKKFPHRTIEVRQTHADQVALSQTAASSSAIAYQTLPTLKTKKPTLYVVYARRKRIWLVIKITSFALVAIAFVCLWFWWVEK